MNHTRELCFNALMPHEMIRGGEREMYLPYSGTLHIHLKSLIKGFKAFCVLSLLQSTSSLCNCTDFIKYLTPYSLLP